MKFINENMYWNGRGKMSDVFKHTSTCTYRSCTYCNYFAPTVIMTVLLCEANIFPLLDE